MILNSPYITGSVTITGNANIQGTIAGAGVNSLVSTASYNADSSSVSSRVTTIENSYATTGSNTLVGTQNITNTTQPTNFDSTAALYTAGGLRVKGNIYASSSLYLKGDLTVYGTQSINYITSSQLDISDNIINVNTATPGVRFGGIAVYDSGSTGLTGSFLWDSQNNKWIYSNPSGSSYDGGMAIFGPRNSSGLGSEQGTTNNALMKGQGGDHITSSLITEDGALMSVYSTMYVSSSGNVGIGTSIPSNKLDVSGSINITGIGNLNIHGGYIRLRNTAGSATYGLLIQTATWKGSGVDYSPAIVAETGYGLNFYTNGTTTERMVIATDGKVGIGTTNPGYKLTVISDTTAALNVQATNATVGSPMLDFYDNGRSQETVISSTDGTTTGTYIASYSNHPLLFGAYANSTPTARMVIATNGKIGIGTSSPDNSYQGLTIYGSDPSLRLKTSGGSGWTWIEFVNSSGTNNFSMGVNQTSPAFNIKAGAGMDSPNLTMNTSGRVAIGTSNDTYAQLSVGGATRMNRSNYNWFQTYYTGDGTAYYHIKTNLWGGGSPNGNTQYTMSLFKGYLYAYSSAAVYEGSVGFHNWSGTIYNKGYSGNLFQNIYVSADGYVVLVITAGSGEAGITIDWHQAYGYPYREAQVTASKLYGSLTGGY